jgi:lysine 2,3-aminomutase
MPKTAPSENLEEEPPGGLAVSISDHLRRLATKSPAIKKQFFPSPLENHFSSTSFIDPLLEEEFTKTKGLVHKYANRVLITLTASCTSYCRFCTRRRLVSDIKKGQLTLSDVDKMVSYLGSHPLVNEVILSGGDPLTVPDLLIYSLNKMAQLPSIKIIRVHTRVPVSDPTIITPRVLDAFKKVKKQAFYISIHFEHPDELTRSTIRAIARLRQTGAILLSQTVFLRGVNDSYQTLKELFTRLSELGIRPYYIYRCDPVRGAEHFIVPFDKEVKIMTKLRTSLSGIACPLYVIDAPGGSGKIPVPLDFWQFNHRSLTDFNGKKIEVI